MATLQGTETLFLASLFVSQGYIVVTPNYAGYDTSTLPYHPYLIADQQSERHDRRAERRAHGAAFRLGNLDEG